MRAALNNPWVALGYRRRRAITAALFAVKGDRCWRCGEPATEPDHIVPISRGGAVTDLTNMRPACRYHNRSRGNTPDPDYPDPSRAW